MAVIAVGNRGFIGREIKLEVRRKSEEISVYEGDELWIELSIENKGEYTYYLEVIDQLPSSTDIIKGSNHQVLRLKKGEVKTLQYKIRCPQRGDLNIGPVKLRYRDPLNLHVEEWTSEEKMELFVLPNIENMKKVNVRPFYTRNWLGNIRSQSMGQGTEFFSLREYSSGDEIKKINWKATARFFEPMSNEYVGEKTGDIIIIVDGHRLSNIGTKEKNTLDASIRAAGTIATSALKDRNRVGLIILGEYLSWEFPDSGREHFYKIMEKLSGITEGGEWELKDAQWLLKRFFPNRSMIIFISPLTYKKVSNTIVDICQKEYNVMIISPDPLSLQKGIIEKSNVLAEKWYKLEREAILEKLWDYSVVIDWNIKEPLEPSMEEVIRYWKKNRRIQK